jgi:ElaB/YqjD/DUF883 family membrane-anchored ribosome-binding protein
MESNVGTTPPMSETQTLKDKATQGTQGIVERAQTQATTRINEAKSEAAQTLSTLASTLHQSGSQLKNEQKTMAADYLERAAGGIEKAAEYLQNTDAGEVVDTIERFARRRPELFIGSAFAVGLIAARFLKSSGRSTALVPVQAGSSAGMADREVPTAVSYERPTVPMERVGSEP